MGKINFSYINELERNLKIREGLFRDLLREDDWSFVIKLHSLIEAASTHLLLAAINKPELENRLVKLTITHKRGFLQDLGLLNSYKVFMNKLTEIRNSFIHDVTNVNTTLEEYFERHADTKSELLKEMERILVKSLFTKKDVSTVMELTSEGAKSLIWLSAMFFFIDIYSHFIPGPPTGLIVT